MTLFVVFILTAIGYGYYFTLDHSGWLGLGVLNGWPYLVAFYLLGLPALGISVSGFILVSFFKKTGNILKKFSIVIGAVLAILIITMSGLYLIPEIQRQSFYWSHKVEWDQEEKKLQEEETSAKILGDYHYEPIVNDLGTYDGIQFSFRVKALRDVNLATDMDIYNGDVPLDRSYFPTESLLAGQEKIITIREYFADMLRNVQGNFLNDGLFEVKTLYISLPGRASIDEKANAFSGMIDPSKINYTSTQN